MQINHSHVSVRCKLSLLVMSGGIFVRRNDEELLLCVIDQIVAIFATIFNGERQIISIQHKKLRIAY